MKVFSPLKSSLLYFIFGFIFIYSGYQSIDETVLNPLTLFLTSLASLNLGVAIRLMQLHYRLKRK